MPGGLFNLEAAAQAGLVMLPIDRVFVLAAQCNQAVLFVPLAQGNSSPHGDAGNQAQKQLAGDHGLAGTKRSSRDVRAHVA